MKKFTALFLAFIMVFALAACGGNTSNTGSEGNKPESSSNGQSNVPNNSDGSQTNSNANTAKILVTYFSATGTTEGVAKTIADSTGADLYENTPEQPYTDADLNYHDDKSRSTVEMNDSNARPAVSGSVENMDQYDIVFIGYPNWWASIPMPIASFLEEYDFSGKTIIAILKENGKNIAEISGAMPNPTVEKLYDGVEIARKHNADLLLAVGGGSVCDYCKAVSVSVNCDEDPWEKYYINFDEPSCEIIPVGCVLTMVGTGSEMNAGSVITNHKAKMKIGHVFADENIMPKFSILNPKYTMTLPHYQMVSGIYDIFNHICEQYFSGDDDNTSDYISEGLMKSLIHSSLIANKDSQDYEARSNIMWTATWALNTLISMGKSTDWMVHMIGQAVGAHTDATHGMTLSAVSLAYYRYILPYGLQKFKRFAVNVWGVDAEGKTDEQVALEGLSAMESWMKELGLVMNISDLGATEDMIEGIADSTIILDGGYKVLNHGEIAEILKKSI